MLRSSLYPLSFVSESLYHSSAISKHLNSASTVLPSIFFLHLVPSKPVTNPFTTSSSSSKRSLPAIVDWLSSCDLPHVWPTTQTYWILAKHSSAFLQQPDTPRINWLCRISRQTTPFREAQACIKSVSIWDNHLYYFEVFGVKCFLAWPFGVWIQVKIKSFVELRFDL
jgi:hypothetical protein